MHPPTLKTLMQKILVGLKVQSFTFSMLSSLKLNFSTTFFLVQLNCVKECLGQILVTIEKLLILHLVAVMLGLSKWLGN